MGISKVQPMRPALNACIDAINDGFDPYVQPYIDAAQQATAQAQAATVQAQAATQAAQAATEAADEATDAATTAAESITDGYITMLTAGAADGIKGGGPTVDAAFLHRVTGGGQASDGPATIEVVRGNTLVWNQQIRVASKTETINNVEFVCDGVSKVVANGTASATAVLGTTSNVGVQAIIGHKYLLKGCPSGGVYNSTYSLVASVASTTGNATDYGSGVIFTALGDATFNVSAVVYSGYVATNVTFTPQLFDLTQMFGAGNEPSTVAEFEALLPLPHYEYDAGSLLSVNMEGIESADSDGNVLAQRSIPATDLRSAGTVYDELRESKRITRVGDITLTVPQTAITDVNGKTVWTFNTADAVSGVNSNVFPNIGCDRYTPEKRDYVIGVDKTDNSICIVATAGTTTATRVLGVYDPNVATATLAEAQAYFAAHPFTVYYAVATPTVTPIDPPLNMSYLAEQGGTETVIVPAGEMSAPVPMVVVYGSTPNGILDRSASLLAAQDGPIATAYHAVGSYLTMDGKLYRVTTAIAIGETITSGTNVTETTVMEEVIRLTQ